MYQFVGAWGPIDDYPETQGELDEWLRAPAPCGACEHATRCATGFACEAFRLFVRNPTRWHRARRQPTTAVFEEVFAEPLKRAA